MSKDYYTTLGISKDSSKEDIKKAFRKLAHQYHPDKKDGNETKFKEVNEAYNVLSNDKKRREYDTYGKAFAGGGAGPNWGGFSAEGGPASGWDFSGFSQGGAQGFQDFDLGDIFSDFFSAKGGPASGWGGRAKRGSDISIDLEISFYDSIFGTERKILLNKTSQCESCGGSGAEKGSSVETCKTCSGKGKTTESTKSFFGTFAVERECKECLGQGKVPKEKCKACSGYGLNKKQDEIMVKIPAGIEDGQMIKLTHEGEAVRSGVSGDLYIKIHIKPDKNFIKEGHNLVTNLNIKVTDAILGGEYTIDTLDGKLKVKVPEGVSFGEVLRVRGKGVPMTRNERGDLLIRVNIDIPKKLSKKAKEALEDLRQEGL